MRKTFSGIMLILLLTGIFMGAFNSQPTKSKPRTLTEAYGLANDTCTIDSESPVTDWKSEESKSTESPKTLCPNGSGVYTEWDGQEPDSGDHWEKVDDDGSHDGENTYVKTQSGFVSGNIPSSHRIDTYNVENTSIPSNAFIYNVTVYVVVKSSSPTYKGRIAPTIRTHNTLFNSSYYLPSTSFTIYKETWTTNPSTSIEWTARELDDLQIGAVGGSGYKVIGGQTAYYPLYLTQVNVTIHWGSLPRIPNERDYSETHTLECNGTDVSENTSKPLYFHSVASNLNFTMDDNWCEQDVTSTEGRWIKLWNISTQDTNNYLFGYEFQYYNTSHWVDGTEITYYDGCGYTGASYAPAFFVDNNTATFWSHGVNEKHWIIVKMPRTENVSKVRIYVRSIFDGSAWENVAVDIGMGTAWTGTSPYINGTDYPTSYLRTNVEDVIIGNFTFEHFKTSTIVDLKLKVNCSGSGQLNAFFWDGRLVDYDQLDPYEPPWNKTFDVPASWSLVTVDAPQELHSYIHLNNMKIAFKSLDNNTKYIDYVQVQLKHYNQSRMTEWLFDSMVVRMINSSLPLIMKYEESRGNWTGEADSELLWAANLYKMTGNQTMLQHAYDYADWLNNTDVCRLFQTYNVENKLWSNPITASSAGQKLLALCILANINSSYADLLERAIENFTNIFVPSSTHRPYNSAYINGDYYDNSTIIGSAYYSFVPIAYAGYLLANDTLKQIAVEMVMNYTLGNADLPHHWIDQDGTTHGPADDYCKEDQTYGFFLLGCESVYHWTRSTMVKNRIYLLANASQYFWNSTYGKFHYMVNSTTGSVIEQKSVHGFGLIDEALINAYLILGNSTWLDWVKSDFIKHVVEGHILWNDLIAHGANMDKEYPYATDCNDYWSAPAKRVALILYNLNVSGYYRNSTYLDAYNKLYAATSAHHKGTLGWSQQVNVRTLEFLGNGKLISFSIIFRNLLNKTDVTLDTFNDVMFHLGNPFTGETPARVCDVAIINVVLSKTIVGQGYSVRVNATAQNQGESLETFNVTLYVNTTIIATLANITLTSENSTTLNFIWNSGFAYGNYTLGVNATHVPYEIDIEDNDFVYGIIKVTIPGDFNGDFEVGPADFAMLAVSYGSTPWQPGMIGGWNPNCDVDGDNKVGPYDFAILGVNYGNKYP